MCSSDLMRAHRVANTELVWSSFDVNILYADDVQFCLYCGDIIPRHDDNRVDGCRCGKCRATDVQNTLQASMRAAHMTLNPEKTVRLEMRRETLKDTQQELLGNYLNVKLEVEKRIRLANGKLNAWMHVFRRRDISILKRVMLYNVLVKPYLTYNIEALPLTQDLQDRLNETHRAHLRKIMGIYYPRSLEVKAEEIYERTGQRPLEVDIAERRWAFFGQVLRQNPETAANRAMRMYFDKRDGDGRAREGKVHGGYKPMALPTILLKEIQRLGAGRTVFEIGRAHV